MRLGVWMRLRDVGPTEMARRVAVSTSFLRKLRDGEKMPSFETAARIRRVTGGQVTLDDWLDDDAPERERSAVL